MDKQELDKVLAQHILWIEERQEGVKLNLAGEDLEGVDLRGAVLCDAELMGANLSGANLEGANLEGANLEGVNLEGVNLRGADIRCCEGDGVAIKNKVGLYWDVAYTKDVLAIGCQQHTYKEWAEFTDEEIGDMDGRAVKFWKEHKAMLLALQTEFN